MQMLHMLSSASHHHQPNASDSHTAPFGAALPLQVQNSRCVCVSDVVVVVVVTVVVLVMAFVARRHLFGRVGWLRLRYSQLLRRSALPTAASPARQRNAMRADRWFTYPPPPPFLRRQTQQLHRVPWFLPLRCCCCEVYSGSCALWSSRLHALRQ